MGCCGSVSKSRKSKALPLAPAGDLVKIQYLGGAVLRSFFGKATKFRYQFGTSRKTGEVDVADALHFVSSLDFEYAEVDTKKESSDEVQEPSSEKPSSKEVAPKAVAKPRRGRPKRKTATKSTTNAEGENKQS